MKAHEILMFLLIFNLALWLLGGYGLNIYNLGNAPYNYSTGIEEGVVVLDEQRVSDDKPSAGESFFYEVARVTFSTLLISVAAVAVAGYLLRSVPTPQLIIYGAFAGIFWTSYLKTIEVFYNISIPLENIGVGIFLMIFSVFTAITVFTFVFGFSQIVTGSWRYMK